MAQVDNNDSKVTDNSGVDTEVSVNGAPAYKDTSFHIAMEEMLQGKLDKINSMPAEVKTEKPSEPDQKEGKVVEKRQPKAKKTSNHEKHRQKVKEKAENCKPLDNPKKPSRLSFYQQHMERKNNFAARQNPGTPSQTKGMTPGNN